MKTALHHYTRWVVALSPKEELWKRLAYLPSLSLSMRKAVLTMCRCQVPPYPGSPFRKQINDKLWNKPIYRGAQPTEGNGPMYEVFSDFLFSLEDLVQMPISCGLLSLAVRIAPFLEDDDPLEALSASLEKELAASVHIYKPVMMDYSVLFSSDPNHRRDPFSSRIPPSERIATSLYECFERSKPALRNRIFWPDIGNKTVGLKVCEQFWEAYTYSNQDWKEDNMVTCQDLERLYRETGFLVDGPVEMRQAWKYNDLKPRVYFARGGTTYHASKYIQGVFNILIDCFEECHRYNRFQEPRSFTLGKDDVTIIYDYASFTSTLDEIRNFIHGLAVYMRDVEITVIDSRDGPIQVNLGDLLMEYNAKCNDHAEFDASVAHPSLESLFHTCGMLGVPGNIFSCTLLHGIHLRFIAGEDNSRTVGDDAKLYITLSISDGEEKIIHNQLTGIGELQEEKMFTFPEQDPEAQHEIDKNTYHFVKRPYYRIGPRMFSGRLITLPNPADIIGFEDAFHTKAAKDLPTQAKKYRKQLDRLIDQIPLECVDYIEEEFELLQRFVDATWKGLKDRLKKMDKITPKQIKDYHRQIAPSLPDDLQEYRSARVRMLQYSPDEMIMVPMVWYKDDIPGYDAGCIWSIKGSPISSWLEKMGFFRDIQRPLQTITRETYGDILTEQVLAFDYPTVMICTLSRDVPNWIIHLMLNT